MKQDKIIRVITDIEAELHVREIDDSTPSRTIAGRSILFNTPSVNFYEDENLEVREVISDSAISRELLDKSDIKFTMYHNGNILLGRSKKGKGTLRYDIDKKGVSFELELPKTANGDEALDLVRRGDIDGCSFAFTTEYGNPDFVERSETREGDKRIVTFTVKQITGIYDFTLAADPAYPSTSVKARTQDFIDPVDTAPASTNSFEKQVNEMRKASKAKLL